MFAERLLVVVFSTTVIVIVPFPVPCAGVMTHQLSELLDDYSAFVSNDMLNSPPTAGTLSEDTLVVSWVSFNELSFSQELNTTIVSPKANSSPNFKTAFPIYFTLNKCRAQLLN